MHESSPPPPPERRAALFLNTDAAELDGPELLRKVIGSSGAGDATTDLEGSLPATAAARLDVFPDALIVTERSGTISESNSSARAMFGPELAGRPLASLFSEGYADLINRLLLNALDRKRLRPLQMRINVGGGRTRTVEASAAVHTEAEHVGRGTRVFWVFRDVGRWVRAAAKSHASARVEREIGKLSLLAVDTTDPGIVTVQACESVKTIMGWRLAVPVFGTDEHITEELGRKLREVGLRGDQIARWRALSDGMVRSGRQVVVEDTQGRLRWVSSSSEGRRMVTARSGALLIGTRSRVRGTIVFASGAFPRTFSGDGAAFLETVAAVVEATYAAVDSREQAASVSALEERTRLAMDIHDSLAQDFSSLVWELSAFTMELRDRGVDDDTIGGVVKIADRARGLLDQTRKIVWDMKTDPYIGKPLSECIEEFLAETIGNRDIDESLTVTGLVRHLQHSQKLQLIRIAQEATGNAVSHSGCSSLAVELNFGDTEVSLSVIDDGIGFDPSECDQNSTPGRGMGLSNMQERARTLGGTLEIDSAPGMGTTVRVTVPAKAVTGAAAVLEAE